MSSGGVTSVAGASLKCLFFHSPLLFVCLFIFLKGAHHVVLRDYTYYVLKGHFWWSLDNNMPYMTGVELGLTKHKMGALPITLAL